MAVLYFFRLIMLCSVIDTYRYVTPYRLPDTAKAIVLIYEFSIRFAVSLFDTSFQAIRQYLSVYWYDWYVCRIANTYGVLHISLIFTAPQGGCVMKIAGHKKHKHIKWFVPSKNLSKVLVFDIITFLFKVVVELKNCL